MASLFHNDEPDSGALVSTGHLPSGRQIDSLLAEGDERYKAIEDGAVADHIPALAAARSDLFAISMVGVDGSINAIGGLCSQRVVDRQTAVLRSRAAGTGTFGLTRAGPAPEQPRREFAPAGSTTSAQDAGLQFARMGPALSQHARRRPQHFQPPNATCLSPHAAPVQGRCPSSVAERDRRNLMLRIKPTNL